MSSIHTMAFHHKEHREWMASLDFYHQEIQIFQKEVAKVLLEFSDLYSIIEHVDEYRDIFSKKMEQIDLFRREIILHERHLKEDDDFPSEDLWSHMELRDKINEFIDDFEKLKINFKGFVSKHLHSNV